MTGFASLAEVKNFVLRMYRGIEKFNLFHAYVEN